MRPGKSIFIVGAGKCGSFIFHRLLAKHPQIAWLNRFCNRLPRYPLLNKTLLYLDNVACFSPVIHKWFPASETTLYWEYLSPGMTKSVRDLNSGDLTDKQKYILEKSLNEHLINYGYI